MTWELDLNVVANVIILISAVIIAIKNIFGFFKKPVDDLQEKAHAEEKKRIEKVLEEKMPGLLEQNCSVIMGSLEEIKKMSASQEKQIIEVQKSLDLINKSQFDVLRYNMNKLYYKYHPYKKILSADKKAFIKLYDDYKDMKGNTWIDALYNELITWEIIEDESELSKNGKT